MNKALTMSEERSRMRTSSPGADMRQLPSERELELMEELKESRAQTARAEATLELMSESMRLLARQMKQADLSANAKLLISDDATTATTSDDTIASEFEDRSLFRSHSSDCDLQLSELTEQLTSCHLAADIMALQNASHMLQQHARLASQEAAANVVDTVEAQTAAQHWEKEAVEAQHTSKRLDQDNKILRASAETLSAEKRILVKEVRSLRKKLSETRRTDLCHQIQDYVAGALTIHEDLLQKSKGTSDVSHCTPEGTNKGNQGDQMSTASTEGDNVKDIPAMYQGKPSVNKPGSEQSSEKQSRAAKSSLGFGGVALGFGAFGKKKLTVDGPPAQKSCANPPSSLKSKNALNTEHSRYEPVRIELRTRSRTSTSDSCDLLENHFGAKVRELWSGSSASKSSGRGSPAMISLESPHLEEKSGQVGTPEITMPRSVAFEREHFNAELPSPLESPEPRRHVQAHTQCDFDVLRSLSIPSVDDAALRAAD